MTGLILSHVKRAVTLSKDCNVMPVLFLLMTILSRVATVRGIHLEYEYFPGLGKVRELECWIGKFVKDCQSQGKVTKLKN